MGKKVKRGIEMRLAKCDDCGTTKAIVGDLRGTLCVDCMNKRSQEHFDYLIKEKRERDEACR